MVTMLQKKFFGYEGKPLSLLAIVCICSLGIACSVVLSLCEHVEKEVADYYEQANLADYRIYKGEFSDSDLDTITVFEEVGKAQRRKVTDMALPEPRARYCTYMPSRKAQN
jgi:putative ABC transport system permease protein